MAFNVLCWVFAIVFPFSFKLFALDVAVKMLFYIQCLQNKLMCDYKQFNIMECGILRMLAKGSMVQISANMSLLLIFLALCRIYSLFLILMLKLKM